MGERAGSGGVRNIRAMFEAKADETSPPSRGRSPANSEAFSSSSRPISKVRTSFVAVEKSGQLGPMLGLRKASDVGEGGSEAPRTPSLSAESRAKGISGTAVSETSTPLQNVEEEEGQLKARGGISVAKTVGEVTSGSVNGKAKGSPSQTRSTTEYDNSVDLGTVLKGSPFESSSPKSREPETPKQDAAKAPAPASTKPSPVKAAVKAFGEAASVIKPKTEVKPTAPRPSAISTKRGPSSKPGSGPQSAKSTKSDKSLKTPTTPKVPSQPKSSRQSLAKPASPKQPVGAKEASKTTAPAKAPVRKTSRLSMAPESKEKSSATAPTATSAAKSGPSKPSTSTATSKKPATQTSTGGFVKPAPKSPTRPKRLPAAATASTAASSAKLGQTSRSPSRATNLGAGRRSSISGRPIPRPTGLGVKPKASRQSLAPTTTSQRERPSSRASATGRGTGEGFLERMMRPTQASASKTHEKLEISSPPKGKAAQRPKRKSEAGTGDEEKKPMKKPMNAPKIGHTTKPEPKAADTKILEPKFEPPEPGQSQVEDPGEPLPEEPATIQEVPKADGDTKREVKAELADEPLTAQKTSAEETEPVTETQAEATQESAAENTEDPISNDEQPPTETEARPGPDSDIEATPTPAESDKV